MAQYGDVTAVKKMLRADAASTFSSDQDARLTALRLAVSAWIEDATGRTFGTGVTTETVVAHGNGRSPFLMLPKAARTVSSVTASPTWSGSTWTAGTTVAATEYRLAMPTPAGEHQAIEAINGNWWSGRYAVSGTFEDTDGDVTVPDDVTYIANYLIAERFKLEQASPSGSIGPDGSVVPVRDALRDPLVAAVIDKWRVSSRVVV